MKRRNSNHRKKEINPKVSKQVCLSCGPLKVVGHNCVWCCIVHFYYFDGPAFFACIFAEFILTPTLRAYFLTLCKGEREAPLSSLGDYFSSPPFFLTCSSVIKANNSIFTSIFRLHNSLNFFSFPLTILSLITIPFLWISLLSHQISCSCHCNLLCESGKPGKMPLQSSLDCVC